jgi:hypothetical protein
MRHKDTIELYNYWNEIRGDREAPLRADVAPAAIARLLPSVMLLQVGEEGEIEFRLAGTRLCALRCEELRDRPFAGIFRTQDHKTLDKIIRAVERGFSIAVLDVELTSTGGRTVAGEILLMPLEDETTRIMGIISLHAMPFWLGAETAEFQLQAMRFLNPDAGLTFLQNRPPVPVPNRRSVVDFSAAKGLRLIPGSGRSSPKRFSPFRVLDGGKK